MGYFGLFIVTFLSATILPFSSELLLIGMLNSNYPIINCVLIATLGNSIGGITNYLIGKIGNPLWLKKFGVKEEKILKQQSIIQKYGAWLALISWIPIIGDPLMIALGFYRVRFITFLILLVIGKATRYIVIGWWYFKFSSIQ
jgi:membrane protein YqaA with SNARE-associated domain